MYNMSVAYIYLCEEFEVFSHCHIVKQNVVLRTQAQTLPDVDDLLTDVIPVNLGRTAGGRYEACRGNVLEINLLWQLSVLRTQAQTFPDIDDLLTDVIAVHLGSTAGWRYEACTWNELEINWLWQLFGFRPQILRSMISCCY